MRAAELTDEHVGLQVQVHSVDVVATGTLHGLSMEFNTVYAWLGAATATHGTVELQLGSRGSRIVVDASDEVTIVIEE